MKEHHNRQPCQHQRESYAEDEFSADVARRVQAFGGFIFSSLLFVY